MSSGFSFYLDAATINAANAKQRGALDVPTQDENDTMFIKSETEKKWREHMMVKDTKISLWDQDSNVVMVTVQYRVTEDGYKKNAKKVFTKSYFIDKLNLTSSGDEKKYKRNQMNIGRLNSLIRACGIDIEKDETGQVPYHIYFSDDKPLVGKTFWGVIRDYTYKNKDDEVVPGQDIDNFIPEGK